MKIKITELKKLMVKVLSSKYYSVPEAEKIAEVLLYAELTGKNTQGVIKLTGTEPMQNIKPQKSISKVKDTKVSSIYDGGGNAAILACQVAVEDAIEKAKISGIAITGAGNIFSSSGVIGYYMNEIAKNDLIGMAFASSPGGVAPHGGLDPLFGTNPIAFGFPTLHDPIIFDMATSAITWYGLVRAKALNQKLPENIAIDESGDPTNDPDSAMKGAILPFANSYKGYGLSMVVELMAGPLVGATFLDINGDWGNLFIAIDPDILIGREKFKKSSSELISIIKKLRKNKSAEDILLPGERGTLKKKKIEEAGEIEIESEILAKLKV